MKPLRLAPLGALLLVVACEDMVCGCPPVDPSARAFLEGTVVDAAGLAVVGAEVQPTGMAGFDCSFDTHSTFADAPAVTDSVGGFEQLVTVSDGPGIHCIEFVIGHPTGGADTLLSDPIRFLHHSEALDSVAVILRIAP